MNGDIEDCIHIDVFALGKLFQFLAELSSLNFIVAEANGGFLYYEMMQFKSQFHIISNAVKES